MHRLWTVLAMTVCLWGALAMGEDAADRMLRRYSDCMADRANAVGSVPLSAEAIEERLRAQLERGEVTMAEIRADYARYCG